VKKMDIIPEFMKIKKGLMALFLLVFNLFFYNGQHATDDLP